MKNSTKHLTNILLALFLSIIFASVFEWKTIDANFMNTVYTISGIMFSIGMGILCTLNPDKIKNRLIYKKIKQNILFVRNNYMYYFAVVSFSYLIYQLFPDMKYYFLLKNNKIIIDTGYITISLNILSILYFIANFIEIQRLNFDISERTHD